MTSLLSAISGQFSKSLLLGTLFPAVFFVLLNTLFLSPFVPVEWGPVHAVQQLDTEWKALALTGLTLLFAGLLYNLNTPIVRFYEGYPWKDSGLGKWMIARKQRRFDELVARWKGLRVVVDAMRADAAYRTRLANVQESAQQAGLQRHAVFPLARSSVLPTRLGNVIRAFEDYPQRQYGIAGITLWPRLLAVIEPTFASGIEDARTSFDFTINVSALSALSALLLLLVGLLSPGTLAHAWQPWLAETAVLALLGYLFYQASIGQAAGWGAMVKSAFDLYRGPLLKKLGFDQLPYGLTDERELWTRISLQLVYGDPPPNRGRLLWLREPAADASGTPPGVALGVTQSTERLATGSFRSHVVVHNPSTHDVAGVTLVVRVPEGQVLVFDSAATNGTRLTPQGVNPYRFSLGMLRSAASAQMTYDTLLIEE